MTESSLLLIDVGNTRIKWGCARNGELSPGMPFAYRREALTECLEEFWGKVPRPEAIWISNVGGANIGEEIANWTSEQWGLPLRHVGARSEGFGVSTRYEMPERLGADRWLALIGARRHFESAVCVVDCGTAVTVDVVDQAGVHLGGLIAPGLGLMAATLVDRLPSLKGVSVEFQGLFGINTASGIAAGARYAVLGLIERCLSELRRQRIDVTLVLTGGDAELLWDELAHAGFWRPHLVLEGLQVLAEGGL